MKVKRESIKILSQVEIDMPCSEYLRLFLAMEAQVLNRPLNSHVNFILKHYLGVQISFKDATKPLFDFFKNAFEQRDSRLTIRLYQNILDALTGLNHEAMKQAIENAINTYLAWVLQDESEGTLLSRQIAQKVQKHMQNLKINYE